MVLIIYSRSLNLRARFPIDSITTSLPSDFKSVLEILVGRCIGQGPYHRVVTLFIEQTDGDRYAFDGIHLDLVEPIPELVVAFNTPFSW